jgi:hypothetical protein
MVHHEFFELSLALGFLNLLIHCWHIAVLLQITSRDFLTIVLDFRFKPEVVPALNGLYLHL